VALINLRSVRVIFTRKIKVKKNRLLMGSLLILSSGVQADVLKVSQGEITLSKDDFRPITQSYVNREAVVGYVALVDLKGSQPSMLFDITGNVSTKWFAKNFAIDTKVTCSGIPVGADASYGYQKNRFSVPATAKIYELRHNMQTCKQIRIELNKKGHLSRQFYTRIEGIDFTIAVDGFGTTLEKAL
jgi:hypothetical protein